MRVNEFSALRKTVKTASGSVAYVEKGNGPVALFVPGVLLNGALWRHVIDELAAERRCIAIDILGHGETRVTPEQDIGFNAQAQMIEDFLAAMGIDQVDLVANDMRMAPQASCDLLLRAAARLRASGLAIATLKISRRTDPASVRALLHALAPSYELVFARQLFHNGDEVTLVACRA